MMAENDALADALRDLQEMRSMAESPGTDQNDLLGAMALLSLNRDERKKKLKEEMDLAKEMFLTGPIIPRTTLPGGAQEELGFAPSGPRIMNLGGSPYRIPTTPGRVGAGLAMLVNTMQALQRNRNPKQEAEERAPSGVEPGGIREAMTRAARAQGY
jgi:hypothetical protein